MKGPMVCNASYVSGGGGGGDFMVWGPLVYYGFNAPRNCSSSKNIIWDAKKLPTKIGACFFCASVFLVTAIS